MNMHTCSYYCDRPECIRAQRNELRQAIEFAEMVEKGTKAWADTPDGWVEDLRGGAEPVAWLDGGLGVFYWACEFKDRPVPPGFEPLYAAYPRHWSNVTDDALIEEVRHRGFTIRDAQISPKREWVGLTADEENEIAEDWWKDRLPDIHSVIKVIEAKVKEKNNGC